MFALIDCNNFYVSCERLFRPDVEKRPVVVLSNNDGCIVSRSAEIKALGIPMGMPFFEAKSQLVRNDAVVFSSNYALYGDVSARVMDTIASLSTKIEVYSIDEAFALLDGLSMSDWASHGCLLRDAIHRHVGIPVSVGLAPTKTLAKIAARFAKKGQGVFVLDSSHRIEAALRRTDVGDVWGIGRRYRRKLRGYGVLTALSFSQLDSEWVRKHMTITGLLTHRELNGMSCLPIEKTIPTRKSVVHSRTFGRKLKDPQMILEALSHFAAAVGEKLRRNHLHTCHLSVFLQSPKSMGVPFFRAETRLSQPSSDSRELIAIVHRLFGRIYRRGLVYRKAGVMALDLREERPFQQSLFFTPPDRRVMAVMDRINEQHGRRAIQLASQGLPSQQQEWGMRQRMRSPQYTTRWSDLRRIHID